MVFKKTKDFNSKEKNHNKNELFIFCLYKIKQGKSQKKHPKLIVGFDVKNYNFMGLISRKSKGKNHNNLPLINNPQFDNPNKSYLRKKIEIYKKENFGDALYDYKLSKKDIKIVKKYVSKYKKR